jgi:hypothetical protein
VLVQNSQFLHGRGGGHPSKQQFGTTGNAWNTLVLLCF